MPPEDRIVPRFAAEPPQLPVPGGEWQNKLQEEFLAACLRIEDEIGEPGTVSFFPDRTWSGRTYQPAASTTNSGLDLFGLVSFRPPFEEGDEPEGFTATADWTDETVEKNPDWTIDICDEVVGGWRGERGEVAAMTVVWGIPVGIDASIATAELGGDVVDQCQLVEGRFTLLAPDAYRGSTLEVVLYGASGAEKVRESLYTDDEE